MAYKPYYPSIRRITFDICDFIYILVAINGGDIMWRGMSNPAILIEIGRRLKEYRIRSEMTQMEVAEHSGVGIDTVLRLERGDNISFIKLIAILRSLDMLENLEGFIPKPPISPIIYKKLMGKQRYRVRKK